jgi:hypothetical protein
MKLELHLISMRLPFICLLVVVLRVELRASHRCTITSATQPTLYVLVTFEQGFAVFPGGPGAHSSWNDGHIKLHSAMVDLGF